MEQKINTFEQKLNKEGLTEEQFLAAYDPNKFERPSVTVDVLVFTVTNEEKENYRKLSKKMLKLLMVKRGNHPDIGKWALPGGFVNMDESLEEAALRELKEETNVDNIYIEQLYTWGDVGRDKRTRIITASYISLVDSSTLNVKADDDADDAKWFTVSCKCYEENKILNEKGYVFEKIFKLSLEDGEDKLSAIVKVSKIIEGKVTKIKREILECDGIAFDHAKIIVYGMERLKNKVKNTDIIFSFMPEFFTLTELQQVYEVISDTRLLKANFRRKISNRVVETDKYIKRGGHRPSKLYMFKSDSGGFEDIY